MIKNYLFSFFLHINIPKTFQDIPYKLENGEINGFGVINFLLKSFHASSARALPRARRTTPSVWFKFGYTSIDVYIRASLCDIFYLLDILQTAVMRFRLWQHDMNKENIFSAWNRRTAIWKILTKNRIPKFPIKSIGGFVVSETEKPLLPIKSIGGFTVK